MGMQGLGLTSVFEPTSPPRKPLPVGLVSDIAQGHLGHKSLHVRQKDAKPILAHLNSIIVDTKCVSSTQKPPMFKLVAKLRGFVNNAAGLS